MRLLHACLPSCKHLPVGLTDSEPARERLRALERSPVACAPATPFAPQA